MLFSERRRNRVVGAIIRVCVLLIFFPGIAFAQVDTMFWFAAPEVTSGHGGTGGEPIRIRISTLDQPSVVTISQPSNGAFIPITVNVPANSVSSSDLTPFIEMIECKPANTILNYGLYISATNAINAYYETDNQWNPDIFALKGRNALGYAFYTPFQNVWPNGTYTPNPYCAFDIVATEDNTQVTITPSQNIVGHNAGIPFTITLNRGQTYSATATSKLANRHLGGSKVVANKKIAVTVKDDSVAKDGCRDIIGDQIVPISIIGTEYAIMKGQVSTGESVFILATQDNTEVSADGNPAVLATINTGQTYRFLITANYHFIKTTKPVYAFHVAGFQCEQGGAILPPLDNCTGSRQVGFTRSKDQPFFLNLMVRVEVDPNADQGFVLNGNGPNTVIPASAFNPIPGNPNWRAAIIDLTAVVPVGVGQIIRNDRDNFHLAMINGQSSTGCSYGYFSSFSSVVLGEDTVLCPNDSLVLDAGPFKDSYLWNDGSTGQYLTVHTPGKYWVDVYNGNCKVTDTINVTYATFPDIDLGDDSLICNGDSYTLDAGAGWTSYLWSDSTTGQSITVDTNGIYWVVVTNLWYCASRDSIEFKLSPDIQVALGNPYICAGESVEITATGASSYQWTPGTGLSTTVGPTVVATPLVTTIYSIIGSDLQNCRDTVPLKITVLGLPLADAGTDKTICYGDSVQLQGSGGFLYSWVPPTGLSDTSVYNPWASPTVTTTYYMTTFGAQGNQFENGDFESIYPGFYSDYTYHTNLNQRGRYYFTDNPKDHFGGYKECGDHTTGTGQMLVVNNSSDVGDHVFCQDIPVIPNTDYAMSLWMQNVHSNTSLPPMQFSINGVSIGNTFTVDTATCVWTQQVEAWYSDTCTVAQFCVINQNSSPSMNGVAFDDISFIKMCYEDDSVTVFVDPLPEAVLSASPVVCSGDSGAIEVTFTGTMPFGLIYGDTITGAVDTIAGIWSNPYSFNVFPGDTNVYYVISVSDANCTNVGSDSAVMPVSTVVLANAGQDTLLCYGESGVLHGSGSGGISPYQYFWSPPTWLLPVDVSDPKVSPLDTIDYILTVTDTNGCFGKDTVRVYVNPPTYVDAGPNKFICFSDSVKIGVIAQGGTAPVSLIWSPTSGLSSATVPTPNASPSDTTEYFLSYYDANGCGGNDSTTVFVNPEILINAGPDHFLCFGESAVLAASASGGRGTLTFQWSPSTGLSDDNALQPIASPVVSTTYILSVSDQSGCVVSDTVVVLVNPELIVDAGANRFVCYGDTIHTTASRTGGIGPFVFLWSPAAGLSNPAILRPVAEPLVSTTYTLLVTDASGCTASDLVVFAVNPEIVLTAGPDKFICFGNSVQIEGVVTGGAAPLNFSWSPSLGLSSTNVADPIASPSVSTTYILSGSDAAGCALADTVIVTVNPEILVSATPDTFICYEDTITLHASFSGGFGALQSGWSPTSGLSAPGSTTTQAFPSVTTNYIFSVQDASGCIVKDTAIVIVNPPILVNCGPDIFLCYGTGVTIPASASGGSAPISVSWSPSAGLSATNITQPYTSPLTTTTYTLSVTDGVGCNVMDSVRVVVNPEILLSAGPDKFICFGDSVILEGAASGGNGAIWTIWSPSAGLDDVFETQPHASPGATTQYIFSVTDQSNCIMRDTVVVTVNPELFVDAGNDVFICYGAPTGLSAAVSGGTPIYSYAWSPSSGLSSTAIANPVANPSDTTVYYFSVTDNSGCTIVDSVEITVNPEIVMTAGPDKFICYGDQVVIEGSASGGFGALNLVWSPTAGLNDPNVAQLVCSVTTTKTYTLTVSDANSCSLQDAVVVTVNPQISVEAGPNKDICYGSGISLNGSASGGTAPLGFSWSPSYAISDTSILNPFVDPLVLTWYLLTVEDANGCIKKDSVRIRPLPELFVSAGPDLFICYGTSKIIQTAVSGGSPGYTYNWSPTTGLNNSHAYRPTATPLVSTTYFLTVTDSRGCKGYDTVFVEVNPELLVSAGPDLPICKFDTILLSGSASGGTPPLSAIWVPATGVVTPTSPTTDFSPPISRIYMLKIIDSRGCTKNDGMWVRVDPLPTATIAGNNIICDGDTADIRIFLTGTPPWQVVYFDTISMTPDTISGIMTSPYSFSDNPDHTNIYYVLSVTDDNGCTNSGIDTAKVIVHPVASVAVGSLSGAFSTICHGDSIELILDLTGTAPWSFVYTDTTEQITYPVNGVVASPYSFWIHPQQTSEWFVVTVVDANSCNSLGTDSISVIVNPLPEGAWGNDTAICINDTAFLQMYLTGTPPWVVIVADTTTGIPDTTSGILSSPWIYPVDPAVSNQYVILEVTDGNLCVGVPNDTLTVIVNELPTAILSGDTLICYGDSAYVRIDFSGATPWSFVFSDTISGAGISYTNLEDDSIIIAVGPDHSNIYYVSAVGDSNTCSNVGTDTVVVEVNPPISVDAGLTQFICFADSATLSGAVSGGTAPYFWGWTPAGSLSDDSTQTPNASPVDTTIFYIEVTDVNSCFANDSVQIDVNPKITVSAGFDKYICFGDSVSLNGHVLGGTPGYIFLWTPVAGLSNPSIINPKASPAVTTTYYLEATDTEGCAVLDSVVVTVNPQINLWAGNDTIICYNTSATLQATVSGGAGGYNYLWSPTSGLNNNHILQPVANPLTSKTYCITVSDASGCQKSDCMQLFVNPKLIVSAGQDKFICYSDSIMLNGLIGGGTAPYSYSWSPVTGIGNPALLEPWVSPANTTNYTLTATDFRNCPGFDIVTVKVNPEILADAGTQKFICYGDTALIEGSVSGGTSPYAISWMPADGLNNTHVIQPNANPDTTTFYSLFVTDTKGCHDTDTVTVIVNPEIFYSAGPDLFICFGDSITISGSASGGDAPFDYSWSPASGLADPSAIVVNASPGVSTSYTLEITDDSGCVKSDVMFLDVNPQLVLDAGPDTFICYGQSFLQPASISGGTQPYSYYWMPLVGLSSPLILQPVFYPNQSRTYYLNVFDINGCQIADSFAVSVNPAISVTACPDRFICFGDSVQISATPSGGSAPYSFSWTPAAPLSTPDSQSTCASPTDTTLFSVLLTDDEGCTASDNMVVGVNPEIFPDAGPDLFICFGDSITFGSSASGGVSPLEFAWTPVAGLNDYSVLQPNASPNSSHDYILTVSDANSCFDKDTMHLTVNPQLHLSAGPDLFICYGDSIAVTAIASGGSPEYSWQWTPSTAISVDTTPDMIAFPLDTTIFSVLLTDSMNCQISDTIEIIVNPQLFVSAGVDLFICYGDSTSFVPSVSGGNGVYEYLWMPSAGLFETDVFAPSASPIDTTEYLFSVSDSNGCVLTDTATIYVNPQLFLNAGTDLFICFADSIQISATASGGYGNLITVWTPDIGLSDDSVLSPTVSPQFSQVYVIDVLDESLCAISDTVSVEVNPELAVDAGFEHFLCYGDSFLLQPDIVGGTLPYAILWSPSTGLSDTSIMQPSAIPLDSTIYSIYVVDGNACSVSDSVAIGVNPEFHAHTSFDEFMCFGDSVPISCWGSGGVLPYIYNWSPASSLDNASIPNPTTGAQSTTVFTISLIDSSGCQATDSIVVAVNPPIFPDAGPDLFLCYLDSLLLEASVVGGTGPYYLYEWSPAAGMNDTSLLQPTVAPDSSTTYYVFISDDNSCGKYDSVHVFVNPPILLSAGPDLFKCYFDSILIAATISGGSPPYLYNWSPATGLSDTAILQPVSGVFDTIMYIVSATDSVGCQAVDTMNLVVNPEILVDAGEDIFLCFMQQDTLHGTAQGGVGQFAGYLWQPVAGIFDTTALNTMVMPDTTTNYTLTATDTNGCYYSDTVLVFVNTPVIPDAGDEITMCYLDTVVFGASVTGGLSPYYYAWTPSQFVQDSTILMASASPPVSYAFTLFVADSLGCSGSDNTLVWVNPLPIISVVAEKDTVCPDEPIEIEASGAVSYQWTPVLPLNQDTGSVVIASIGTETIFTVTGTDINGCINDTTDTVSVFPQLSILSLSANPYTICNGDSVWIEVELSGGNGGPFFFDWNSGLSVQEPPFSVFPQYDTTYNLVVSDSCTVPVSDSIDITVIQQPWVLVTPDTSFCEGETILISAESNCLTFTWSNNTHHDYLQTSNPGTFWVKVDNLCGSAYDTVLVKEFPFPVIALGFDQPLCNAEYLDIDAENEGATYIWSTGDTTRTIRVFEGVEEYWVIVEKNGCISADTLNIMECAGYIELPLAFTPNNDGRNDVLYARGYGVVEMHLALYNRHGELLWETNDINVGWDGKYKEIPQEVEVYVWYLTASFITGDKIAKKGDVTLIR